MKKLFIVIILGAFAYAITGCSDDDTPVSNHLTIGESIIGKWNIEGGTINGGQFENYIHSCETEDDYQEFTAGGILKFIGYSAGCTVNDIQESSYTISDNVLIVQDENDPTPNIFTITSLTSSQLVLQRTVNTPDGVQTQVSYFSRD